MPSSLPLRSGDALARSLIVPLILLLVLILLIFYVLFTSNTTAGDSMLPTLHDGDRTLVTRGYGIPRRGDVIVFVARTEHGQQERLVKRIVAIPGDTVSVRGGVAIVNGRAEDRTRIVPDPEDPVVIDGAVVPPGHVFVLGDNRLISLDSRRLGFIPLSNVIGAVRFVWAPLWRIGPVR